MGLDDPDLGQCRARNRVPTMEPAGPRCSKYVPPVFKTLTCPKDESLFFHTATVESVKCLRPGRHSVDTCGVSERRGCVLLMASNACKYFHVRYTWQNNMSV